MLYWQCGWCEWDHEQVSCSHCLLATTAMHPSPIQHIRNAHVQYMVPHSLTTEGPHILTECMERNVLPFFINISLPPHTYHTHIHKPEKNRSTRPRLSFHSMPDTILKLGQVPIVSKHDVEISALSAQHWNQTHPVVYSITSQCPDPQCPSVHVHVGKLWPAIQEKGKGDIPPKVSSHPATYMYMYVSFIDIRQG